MAAADYYTGMSSRPQPIMSQQPSYLSPPPRPQRVSSQPNIQYSAPPQQAYSPIPPPPPYSSYSSSPGAQKPPQGHVHFAPSPQPSHQNRPGSSSGGGPSPQSMAPVVPYIQNTQAFVPQQHLQPYAPQPQAYQNNYSQSVPNNGNQLAPYYQRRPSDAGYSSDPERHRHKHKKHHSHSSQSRSRSRSRDTKDRPRRTSEASRSSNSDGLIGAAGGGLIGDLIFPGLGTVGGALVGWLGGKKYGSERKHREDRRDKTQYDWEERWNKPHRRDDLAYGDEDSSGRRKSYDDRDRKHRY